MTAYRLPPEQDPTGRIDTERVSITVDGLELTGPAGSTIAGVLLENGRDSWRTTSRDARPRGIFCGIGVCYDCILTVGAERDVRACQRRACDGDIVSLQSESRPDAGGSTGSARVDADRAAGASESQGAEDPADTGDPTRPDNSAGTVGDA